MIKSKCPKCHSSNVKFMEYLGSKALFCRDCRFHESEVLDKYPSERKSQREKGRYSPYKTGGKGRSK